MRAGGVCIGVLAVMAALAVLLAAPDPGRAAIPAAPVPYSSHAQVYACCTSSEAKEASFREAKESGAAYIRVDVDVHGVFDRRGGEHWDGTDEVADMSRRYQLPVLAVVLGSADPRPGCAPHRSDRERVCPPADIGRWSDQVGRIATRYAGTIDHFEIWNEPDGTWAFEGSPADYATMLASVNHAIKDASPGAAVVLGGTMNQDPRGLAWLDQAFRTPGVDAARAFDIGSIHLRGSVPDMKGALAERIQFLRGWGRTVPVWVTEHGYPGDPAWQPVAGLRAGEASQALALSRSLPTLALAGAQQTFVTLRDHGAEGYASEGIVRGTGVSADPYARKPGFLAVREAARRWPALAFRPAYVASRLQVLGARSGRGEWATPAVTRAGSRRQIVLRGRFGGPDCAGRMQLRIRLPRRPVVTRTVAVGGDCSYATLLDTRVRIRPRSRVAVSVEQRFLGNESTGPGDGPRLVAMVKGPRRPAARSSLPERRLIQDLRAP